MPDPMVLLFGALTCWLLAGVAIRVGWDSIEPGSLRIARTCCALAFALLLMTVALVLLGLAGFLTAA